MPQSVHSSILISCISSLTVDCWLTISCCMYMNIIWSLICSYLLFWTGNWAIWEIFLKFTSCYRGYRTNGNHASQCTVVYYQWLIVVINYHISIWALSFASSSSPVGVCEWGVLLANFSGIIHIHTKVLGMCISYNDVRSWHEHLNRNVAYSCNVIPFF